MNDELPPPTPIRPRDTSNDAEFRPTVSFDGRAAECSTCGAKEFVLGFEAGLLSARLEASPSEFRGTYHSSNADMLERIAGALGYFSDFSASGDPLWTFATFTKSAPKKRLSVVPKEEL